LLAALRGGRWDDAAEVLERAEASKPVEFAALRLTRQDESFTRHFGKTGSDDAMFLLDSISKPINVTAIVTLFDRVIFRLNDRVRTFLPTDDGDGRGDVTIRHLLAHTSGLPDQLADDGRPASGSARNASRGCVNDST
jgi:CubicO group peptidase (beta-lactamase class C family)